VEVQSNLNRSVYPIADGASGALRPVWAGDELLLARRVVLGRRPFVQVCRVDWPATRAWLLQSVRDLLPEARLVSVAGGVNTGQPDARLLASLPVRLEPGALPPATNGVSASPLRVSLVIAWACVLAATSAVGLLLAGVASLSERRGAFVSAVTHELRTPLTTLRMYTEMLADGMVGDEAQRKSYLQTLRAEADRLGHLVENILAYSRLERNRAGYEQTEMTLGEAVSRTVDRLADRARQAGMSLQAELAPGVLAARVRTNALALEQILFNLVDNACKYAAGVPDRTIRLTAAAGDGAVLLTVRDHGPGLQSAPGRLFRAFNKSVQDAANTAPGLGLGLALSRRLARSMGGDLRLDPQVTDGAAFVVSLPRAPG
jgi:signal transduction histidine kinase